MVWSWHVLARESNNHCTRILGLLLRHISCEQEYSGQLIFLIMMLNTGERVFAYSSNDIDLSSCFAGLCMM